MSTACVYFHTAHVLRLSPRSIHLVCKFSGIFISFLVCTVPEFGHMPFCHQLSFPPLLPPCQHLRHLSAHSCAVAIVALAIYLDIHHHHNKCNTNNNTITVICSSIPQLSLRLSPCSIHLVCKSPELLYRFLRRFTCAQLTTPAFIYRCPCRSAIICPFQPCWSFIPPPAWY